MSSQLAAVNESGSRNDDGGLECGSLAETLTTSSKRKRLRSEFPWNHTHPWAEGDPLVERGKAQCTKCRKWFSRKTNASGWKANLSKQHALSEGGNEDIIANEKRYRQLPLASSCSPLTLIKFENAIVDFVIHGGISLREAGNDSFKCLVQSLSQGYEAPPHNNPSSMELHTIMLPLVSKVFNNLDVAFSLTIDGWTNRNLKGFWMVTAHWIDTTAASSKTVLLTILDVEPGRGVGKRIGIALFECLKSLGATVLSNLIAVVSDNGSDAITTVRIIFQLTNTLLGCNKLQTSSHIRCADHSVQI
jgi:hypothetical protein